MNKKLLIFTIIFQILTGMLSLILLIKTVSTNGSIKTILFAMVMTISGFVFGISNLNDLRKYKI